MAAVAQSVVYYQSHSIRKFLQTLSNKQRLQSCLLVTPLSQGRKDNNGFEDKGRVTSSDHQYLSTFVDRTVFAFSVEAGLRSVQSNIVDAYPTVRAIEESVTLAKRLGAQVVVGVGSGAAIDVAKSVATILTDEDSSNDIDLILSPATLGGCLASTSEEPLLLSTEEEALLPLSSTSELWNESMHPVIPTILMDEKDFDTTNDSLTLPPHFSCGVLASLVIALDAAFFATTHNCRHLPHGADYTDSIYKTIDHAMEALTPHHGSDTSSRQRHAVSAALYSGNVLNLGNRYYQRRSAPISIASALLPPFFPHGNILTYIASMLPGLCATISEYRDSTVQSYDSNNYILLEHAASRLTEGGNSWKDTIEWANRISTYHNIPTMASLAEGAPATSTLLDRMESNQLLLNVTDSEDIDYLGEILQRSLNR